MLRMRIAPMAAVTVICLITAAGCGPKETPPVDPSNVSSTPPSKDANKPPQGDGAGAAGPNAGAPQKANLDPSK